MVKKIQLDRLDQWKKKTMKYDPADVLIHVREPYNKNTLWIQPTDEDIQVKIYDKGWKTILSTKDSGLSSLSLQQVKELVTSLNVELSDKLVKQFNRSNQSLQTTLIKIREAESKIAELDNKVEKLTKRYSTVMAKVNQNGR